MKPTKTYRIHGFLKTLSPLHIASPTKARWNHEKGEYAKGTDGIACTPIQRMALPILRKNEETGAISPANVPVYTANSLNGALRRSAAAIVFDALLDRKEQVAIDTYSAMTCGAVTGKPDGNPIMFDEYREVRNHPFLGLFGGGPRMMTRHVRVHNMVPITEETEFMFAGVAKHPALDDVEDFKQTIFVPKGTRLVQVWTFTRSDDLRDLTDAAMQSQVIADFEKKFRERQALILSDKESKENQEEGGRFSTRVFSAFEFVVPGVYFPMTFELNVTEEQMGLFLLALDRFAETERIGSMSRNGFGQFSLEKVVLTEVDTDTIHKNLFLNGRLNRTENSPALPYLKKWADAAPKLSAARLDYLMRPPVQKKEKGKKGEK